MSFRSENHKLTKAFNKRRLEVINKKPLPVSSICDSCWYKASCILNTLKRSPPLTCAVYTFFTEKVKQSATLQEVVTFTCENKCKSRQGWQGDPVPHDENYCDNHCPVSGFILKREASTEEEVPKLGDF